MRLVGHVHVLRYSPRHGCWLHSSEHNLGPCVFLSGGILASLEFRVTL